MKEYDYIQIAKLLTRECTLISNSLIELENRYLIFKKMDELDIIELFELKLKYKYYSEFEQKLLCLCDYLLRNNAEN